MEEDRVHGLTAAYALNALDQHDEAEYEDHLGRCPTCQRELASLQDAAAALAYGVDAPAPPAALRARILTEARRERTDVVPLRPRWVLPAAASVAAVAATAAIALGIWAASLSSELDDQREARAELSSALAEERRARADDARALALLAAENVQRFPLEGADGVLVVDPTRQAALVVTDLRSAPTGKAYEAWVIEAGKPRPAGLFQAGMEGTVVRLTRPVPARAIVAVTLEDDEGVDQPTGSPLFTAQT